MLRFITLGLVALSAFVVYGVVWKAKPRAPNPVAASVTERVGLVGTWKQTNGHKVWTYVFTPEGELIEQSGPQRIETERGPVKIVPEMGTLYASGGLEARYKLDGNRLQIAWDGGNTYEFISSGY